MVHFSIRHWFPLIGCALGAHLFYIGLLLACAGSLITKHSFAVGLANMRAPLPAIAVAVPVLDVAEARLSPLPSAAERALAEIAEEEPAEELPLELRTFQGRGLLSEKEVVPQK